MAEPHFGSCYPLAVSPGTLFRKVGKWAGFARYFLKHAKQALEKFFIEARPDFSGEPQLFALVSTNQKRAEMTTRTFRLGVTANNELLLVVKLQFDPVAGAASGFIVRAH